jgi:hypothetical protein
LDKSAAHHRRQKQGAAGALLTTYPGPLTMDQNVLCRARKYLAQLPDAVAGTGGHNATLRAASVLVGGFGLDERTALQLLEEWNAHHCHPAWSRRELLHKIRSAAKSPPAQGIGHLLGTQDLTHRQVRPLSPPEKDIEAPAKWPTRDRARITEVARHGARLVDLIELSPHRPHELDAEHLVDVLFPGNPLLCVSESRSVRAATTLPRESLRGTLATRSFMVPSPMTALNGETQLGKTSVRCLANTGPRRFLVIECDFSTGSQANPSPDAPMITELAADSIGIPDICAAVLHHLGTIAPLALAVHSGGKSIHGWFPTLGQSEERVRRFMRYAVSIGADPATWTPCQFVRLPGGTRDNGVRQHVLFFSPDRLEK